MEASHIRAVVSWLKSHPEHAGNFDTGDVAYDIIAFISDPNLVDEYEDVESQCGPGDPVEDGCNYLHQVGPRKGLKCHQARSEGKEKCSFHDHVIFSCEIRDEAEKFKQSIRTACLGL